MKFVKFLIVIGSLYPSLLLANLANIQKFRLAKAKVALENEDHHSYKKLIKLNISNDLPHIASLIHWGEYLFNQKEYSKAFRSYHQAISRLHSKKLLQLKDNSKIKETINVISIPEHIIKKLYFNLASYYLKLYKNRTFNKHHKKRFQLKAQKYLTIAKLYDYQVFYTTYHLGKIKLDEGQKEEAYVILSKARNIPSKRTDASKLKDDIDLILAESLYDYAKQDSSQLYLRGIYQNQERHASSREYAKYYFNSLEKDYFGSTISYLIKQKYNLHELTNTERELINTENFKEEFGVEDGVVHLLNFQTYINKKFNNRWSLLGSFNFATEKTAQDKAKRADSRYLSLGLDFKKFTVANSLYKINYHYNALWTRSLKGLSMQKDDDAHTIRPEYTYTKKHGAMTWGGIYSVIKDTVESKTALGVTWSYHRHNRSKWWSPTYSVELIKQSEILEQTSSTIINLALSTPSLINEKWTLFSAFDFSKNGNTTATLDFTRYELSLSAQRQMELLKNLYFDIDFRNSNKSYGNGNTISVLELGAGCTYNF